MVITIAIGLAGIALAAQSVVSADRTFEKRWKEEGISVEIEGICSFSETDVRCWNVDGVLDPSFESKIRQAANNPNSGLTIESRSGKKNRTFFIQVTQPWAGKISYPETKANQLSGPRIALPQKALDFSSTLRSQQYTVTQYFEKDQQETSFDFTYDTELPDIVNLKPKRGDKVQIEGTELEYVSVEEGQRSFPGFGQSSPYWVIRIRSTSPTQKGHRLRFRPLDAKGKEINYVDGKGNPLSDEQIARQNQGLATQRGIPLQTELRVLSYEPSMVVLQVNVNPSKIASLQVRAFQGFRVRITGIPLDPKPN